MDDYCTAIGCVADHGEAPAFDFIDRVRPVTLAEQIFAVGKVAHLRAIFQRLRQPTERRFAYAIFVAHSADAPNNTDDRDHMPSRKWAVGPAPCSIPRRN